MSISEADARTSLTAILAAAAAATGRAELINAPTVFTGFSLGGFVSTEMANDVPDRVIASVAQRGSSELNSSQLAETRKVPVLFMPGSEDSNGLTEPNYTSANFSNWRTNAGHSAYAVDWRTPHDTFVNQGWSMAWSWIAESVALRYPAGVLPGLDAGNTVTLNAIPLENGWLGQRPYVTSTTGEDRSPYVTIAPYTNYSGTVGTASWLPNETVARAYQASTSYDGISSRTEIPLQGPLAIVGAAKPCTAIQPGQVNPPQMAVLPVGSTFDIAVDPRGFGDSAGGILSMAYYDGSQLLALQNAPGTNGWKYAHTLSSRGIHTLTAVATDALGNKTAALRTVVAAGEHAQGTSLYRFERSPGLTTDHYDLLNLTTNATTGPGPQQVALGAAGAGAAFPRSFEGAGGPNDHAARFTASKGDVFTCADSPLLPSGTTPFTVEAFVNLASGGAGGTFRTIAAHGTGSTGSTLSWQLVVTGETSGQGARRLVLQICGSAAGALDTINSGFELQTNVDYYVASAFTPTNTSASGITFYVKDLSAGSTLQASSRTHTQTSITNASTAFAIGNRNDRGNGWDGVLDEVRLTTRALSASELLVNQIPLPTTPGLVTPEDSRIAYSDYVRRSFVSAPFDATVTLARFDRLLPMAGKGYEWDNPGTRIRFRTDATNAQATLYYSTNHCSTSARNSKGLYLVDGVTNAAWTFQTVQAAIVRTQEQVAVSLTVPNGGGFHDYELVLPYGDSVDFRGLQVNTNAQFQTPAERPATRYLAYGDSITQGFTASEVGKSYGYLVARNKGWQLVNLGLAGRATTASDGTTVGSLGADVISVLIGVHDWQGGVPLATYSNRLDAFLTNLRTLQPTAPVYLLTPLWVDASWDPASDIAPLESYRQVVRDVAGAKSDPKLFVIEGPALIDPSIAYFDPVLVHPNDLGFAMMAARLVAGMETATTNATNTTAKAWLGGVNANWGDAAIWTPTGVPVSSEAVSISNSAAATLTVQSGTAAVAASLAFDNANGKNATLSIAHGGSLAVAGAITDVGAGNATLSIGNTNPVSAASVLSATSAALTTLGLSASAFLTTGFDITLASQLQLGVGTINTDITYRQTNGTVNIAGQGYGLCMLEAYARPTAGTQTYILDGGTLKAERIGVGNGNGSNIAPYYRYAGTGVLDFNNGTIATRSDTLSVWFENGSAMETYNGTTSLVPDAQRNTSRPVTVRLSQSGTHTFNATHVNNQIVLSPSARLVDKAGEAGTLTKTGPGSLTFTGGGLTATNSWTGDTTVSQGTVKVDYNTLAGAQGGMALLDAYSPRSKLVLSGGGFELAGRSNATNSTFGNVAISVGSASPWSGNYTVALPSTAGLVVGQAVSNAFLPVGTYIRFINSATSVALSHMPTGVVDQTGQTVAFGAANFTSAQTVSNVVLTGAASAVTVTPRGLETLLMFGNVTGAGGLAKAGAGTLKLTGTVTFAGTCAISAGTLDFACAGLTMLTNAVTGAGVFRHSGTGVTAVDAGSGVTNTFSGAVVVDGGTLQQGSANDNQRRGLSAAASYTVNSGGMIITARDSMNDYASYSLNGGTLKMAKGFQQIGGAFTLNNGALVTGPGQGPLYQAFALNGNVVVTGAAPSMIRAEAGANNGVHLAFNSPAGVRRTFRVEDVTGSAAADLTVSASLLDSSHTGSSAGLAKTGEGTLVFVGGTNTYSGATAVSNGVLLVSGGGMSNSAVTVSAGAAFGAADATLSRVASLALAEGARLVWKYDGNAKAAGRIVVTGTLALPASLTLDVSGSGFLYSNPALFSAGEFAGATDLSGWTITGMPYRSSVVRVGNELILRVNRGMILKLR
jgi:autotransporter-associated beta strand protein